MKRMTVIRYTRWSFRIHTAYSERSRLERREGACRYGYIVIFSIKVPYTKARTDLLDTLLVKRNKDEKQHTL